MAKRGAWSHPAVSPDGKLVSFAGYEITGRSHTVEDLYLVGIDGSNMRKISGDYDRDPVYGPRLKTVRELIALTGQFAAWQVAVPDPTNPNSAIHFGVAGTILVLSALLFFVTMAVRMRRT